MIGLPKVSFQILIRMLVTIVTESEGSKLIGLVGNWYD